MIDDDDFDDDDDIEVATDERAVIATTRDAPALRAQKLATRRRIEEAMERRRFREEFGDDFDYQASA